MGLTSWIATEDSCSFVMKRAKEVYSKLAFLWIMKGCIPFTEIWYAVVAGSFDRTNPRMYGRTGTEAKEGGAETTRYSVIDPDDSGPSKSFCCPKQAAAIKIIERETDSKFFMPLSYYDFGKSF